MSALKWLDKLLFVENVLGIYRSYCNQKKITKYLIIFQVSVQTILHAVLLLSQVIFLTINDAYKKPINLTYCGYAISAFVTATPSVFTGIIYSRAFQTYLENITRVFETFKDDKHKKLINSLKKLYWLSVILVSFFVVFGVLRSIDVILRHIKLSYPLYVCSIMVSQSLLRTTVLFSYLMFFVTIMIVYHLSKCLTSLVSDVQERVGRSDINSDEECDITKE